MSAGTRTSERFVGMFLAIALALPTCSKHANAPDGRRPLQPPPAGPLALAGGAPTAPFDDRLGEAAFARDVFGTAGPSGTVIAVRDVLIGPHAEAGLPGTPGPSLVDLRGGSGSATVDGKVVGLSTSQPTMVPTLTAMRFKNDAETPLIVRLYTFSEK